MVNRLLLVCIFFLLASESYPQGKDESRTRIYLNNSARSYSIDGSSSFSTTLLEAFESANGNSELLSIDQLFKFFQSKELEPDTVTDGKKSKGHDYTFASNDKTTDHALLVYVEEYDSFDNLTGISSDVSKIELQLKESFNYQTEVLKNPTRVELLMAIKKYTGMSYKEGDHLFIYFAGRGYFDTLYQRNYLLLKDSQENDEVNYSYMPVSQLLMLADNIPAEKVMVFLDAGTK